MDMSQTVLAGLLGAFLVISLVRIFKAPLRLAFRLLTNTLLGFLTLWLIRATAGITGLYLGLNLWNSLIIGCLGAPGLALLLLAKWVL